jgi:hypothetical protein
MANNIGHAEEILSAITPVYYKVGALPYLFAALEQELAVRRVGLELIFINDGSGDNSLDADGSSCILAPPRAGSGTR